MVSFLQKKERLRQVNPRLSATTAAAGITGYVFFVILIMISIVLELKPGFLFSQAEDTLSMYLSEFFLIVLPLLLFIVYFFTFKLLLVRSKMQ